MSRRRRVLIITRRFWPCAEDSTFRLQNWLSALTASGASATVLTARHGHNWSRRFTYGEIPVVRLDTSPTNVLRNARYLRQLVSWVRAQAEHFDLIYFDQAELEANAILTQIQPAHRPPVIVRFSPFELAPGSSSDFPLNDHTLNALRRAPAVIVPNQEARQMLLAAGILGRYVHVFPDLRPAAICRTAEQRSLARTTLANANTDLWTRATDQLVVCIGDLSRRWGVNLLMKAVGPLLETHRSLRVWILGDGPERESLYSALRYEGWHHLIALPGIFVNLEEVIQAANLCVFPTLNVGQSFLMPSCIESGLPVLASECRGARELLGAAADTLLFRSAEVRHLRYLIEGWMRQPQRLANAMDMAQQSLRQQLPSRFDWERFFALTASPTMQQTP